MQAVVHKLSFIQTALLKPTESPSSAVDKLFAQSIGGSIHLEAVIQSTYTAFLCDSIAISVRNHKHLRMLIEQAGRLRKLRALSFGRFTYTENNPYVVNLEVSNDVSPRCGGFVGGRVLVCLLFALGFLFLIIPKHKQLSGLSLIALHRYHPLQQ